MEPQGSLPHSQAPATYPYTAPDQSIPCPAIPLLDEPFYYPPIHVLVFQVVCFSLVSQLNPYIHPIRGNRGSTVVKVLCYK